MARIKLVFADVDLADAGDVEAVGRLLQTALGNQGSTSVATPAYQPTAIAQLAVEDPPPPTPEKPRRSTGRPPGRPAAEKRDTLVDPANDARNLGRAERLDKIENYLTKVCNATGTEISHALNIPIGSITALMADPRFRKMEDGSYRVD